MEYSHSLAFPVIRQIHEHQVNPPKNKMTRFYRQEVLDRCLGLTLSFLALADIGYHVAGFTAKATQALYERVRYKQPLSFQAALTHLKVAKLFFSTFLIGSLVYGVMPSEVSNIFENSQSRFTKALLLSGSPEVFDNPSKAGGTFLEPVLDTFCREVKALSPEVKASMGSSLALVEEAHALLKKRVYEKEDVTLYTFNVFYEFMTECFDELYKVQGGKLKQFMLREVVSRIALPFFALYATWAIIYPISLLCLNLLQVGTYKVKKMFSNQDQDKELKKYTLLMKLNFTSVCRHLIALPVCLTAGVWNPRKIQKLLFSPFYEKDQQVKDKFKQEMLHKIEQLQPNASLLVPMFTYTADPYKNGGAHAYGLLITKKAKNYQLSIVNRGFGSNWHTSRGIKKRDVDYSWDNIEFAGLAQYLDKLLQAQNAQVAHNLLKLHGKRKGTLNPFMALIYAGPGFLNKESYSRRITTNHSRSLQKIGNCGVSNLLGAVSLHRAMQTGNLQDKEAYKKFIYALKEQVFKEHGYLLDFDLSIPKRKKSPTVAVKQKLAKMKAKLAA